MLQCSFKTEVLRPKDYHFQKGGFTIVVMACCDVKAWLSCNHSGSRKLFHALDCQLPPQYFMISPSQTQPSFSVLGQFFFNVHAYWSWLFLTFLDFWKIIIIIVNINYIQICLCSAICIGTKLLACPNLIFCWTKLVANVMLTFLPHGN
jgi:hypothetical protein